MVHTTHMLLLKKSPYLDLFQITDFLFTLDAKGLFGPLITCMHVWFSANSYKRIEINFDTLNVFPLVIVHFF